MLSGCSAYAWSSGQIAGPMLSAVDNGIPRWSEYAPMNNFADIFNLPSLYRQANGQGLSTKFLCSFFSRIQFSYAVQNGAKVQHYPPPSEDSLSGQWLRK